MKRCHRSMASGSIIFLVCLFFFFHFMRNSGLRTVKKKEKKTAVGTNLVFCFPKTETVVGTAHEGDVSRRGPASKALSREQQPGSKTSRRAAGGPGPQPRRRAERWPAEPQTEPAERGRGQI